jgi:hypothetical protein
VFLLSVLRGLTAWDTYDYHEAMESLEDALRLLQKEFAPDTRSSVEEILKNWLKFLSKVDVDCPGHGFLYEVCKLFFRSSPNQTEINILLLFLALVKQFTLNTLKFYVSDIDFQVKPLKSVLSEVFNVQC